MVPTLEVILMG